MKITKCAYKRVSVDEDKKNNYKNKEDILLV